MLNNNISDYTPIPLKSAQLEPGEEQKYSFRLAPCEKQLFGGYKLQIMVVYFCHFTNRRLILEIKEMGKEYSIAKWTLRAMTWFVDVPIGQDLSIQYDLNRSKNLSDSQAGKYSSISYSEIKAFEIIKSLWMPIYGKILLKNPPQNLGDNRLVFAAFTAKEKASFNFSNLNYRSTDFVEVGNRMLHEYAATSFQHT